MAGGHLWHATAVALIGALVGAASALAAPPAATLVKDINPGQGSSRPGALTNVGGTLFFTATDTRRGRELWKSDGTVAGTKVVRDINHGKGSSSPQALRNVGGTLFFAAEDGTHGIEL